MKIKIWPDDTTVPEMDDWLAELRDGDRAEFPGANRVEPPAAPELPAASAAPEPPAEPAVPSFNAFAPAAAPEPPAEPAVPSFNAFAPAAAPELPAASAAPEPPAEPAVPSFTPFEPAAEPAAPAEPATPAPATERAVIGDQLRMPICWCEMGSCISWHADPAALGEGDQRARAIEAGWRLDAFGRLACPRCQQADPGFRATHPVVPWDRYTAMVRAARIAAATSGVRAPGY
jgi:hypothetical protein